MEPKVEYELYFNSILSITFTRGLLIKKIYSLFQEGFEVKKKSRNSFPLVTKKKKKHTHTHLKFKKVHLAPSEHKRSVCIQYRSP